MKVTYEIIMENDKNHSVKFSNRMSLGLVNLLIWVILVRNTVKRRELSKF